jgi:uncharacterized protein (TIGR01777 family)
MMRILISGSSGLIGSALCDAFAARGWSFVRLIRFQNCAEGMQNTDALTWEPEHLRIGDVERLEGFDAIIHLGGANIAAKRWTKKRKEVLRTSRIRSTSTLASAIQQLQSPPRLFLCASATGYYGNRGDELLTEKSAAGTGFLAQLGIEWEDAAFLASSDQTRVVTARFGIVLDKRGGALKKMLPVFTRGLGGRLGTGRQFWSWISLEDATRALLHIIDNPDLKNSVNVTSPDPVTNEQFTQNLAAILRRPARLPVPGFLLQLLMGELASEALLASARVMPEKLIQCGFQFNHPTFESAMSAIFKHKAV